MTTATLTTTTMSITGGGCSGGTVQNSDASYTASVPSGGSLVLPNSNVSVNGSPSGQLTSVKQVNIQVVDGVTPITPDTVTISGNTVTIDVPAAVSRSTAQLMKTGQTTSYRTGDDGDLEAGRSVSFTVLAENNPFGNTNRFTDELGGSTYTNNIVIDWSTYNGSTVLGWRRTLNGAFVNWNTAIDGALAVSIAPFTTGWRLPNVQELSSICVWDANWRFNYAPFNIGNSFTLWSSTTASSSTSNAVAYWTSIVAGISAQAKTTTSAMMYFPCRTFTVTGTTLT
jgi:hypothetical protein